MENREANIAAPAVKRTEQETTIDLLEIFYLLLGHLWQIVLAVVIGGVAAFAVTYFFVTPQYQASAKMYIVSASNDSVVNLTDLQVGSQLTSDYQDLLRSRPLLQDVIANLDLNMSYGALAEKITITNAANTRILKITVSDPDPALAAEIANELVTQACAYLPRIMETNTPNIVETAVVPTQKSSPSYSRNTALGALLAAALYCAVLIVSLLLNDTLVTPDDVEKYFGAMPLATIPEGDLGEFDHQRHSGKHDKRRSRGGRI